jgi:hypothetical protein
MSPRVLHLALIAAIALLVSAGTAWAADAPFAWSVRFESELGTIPTGIALGDFDLDGDPDYAVTYAGDSVAILLGDGKGGIGPRRTYAVPSGPGSVVVADFNQDGRPDLAIPSASHVTILLGKPLGEFGGRVDYPTGSSRATLAVADFDNDSKLDLAVSSSTTNQISILRGTGTGAFHPETNVTVGLPVFGVAAGDVDHDGKADVVATAGSLNKLLFLRGRGDGSFDPQVETTVDLEPQTVALGDLDGDGDLDAVTANFAADNLAVAYWNGTGFAAFADLLPADADPMSAVIGDVSGDGRPDIVATYRASSHFSIFRQTETGFGPPETVSDPRQLLQVALGDVDHDGRLDVAVAARNLPAVLLFRNLGGGPLSPKVDYPTIALPAGTTFVDATGDGRPDLLNVSYLANVLSLRPGDGEGSFGARVDLPAPLPHPEGLATADVNRDGIPDLAVFSGDQDTLKVVLGTGAGTFVPGSSAYLGYIAVPRAVAFGRVNADTFPDMVVANAGLNAIRVFLNDGSGGFGVQGTVTEYLSGAQPSDVLLVDVDGDADQDLAYVNTLATTLAVRKNDGTGLFGPVTGGATPAGVRSMAAGDLNADGRMDFVTCSTGAVSVFLNPGNGIFTSRTDLEIYPSASDVAIADLDGDGRPDLLVTNNEGHLDVFFGNGKGAFGPAQPFPSPLEPGYIAVADVDADGRPDVALRSSDPPALSVYLSRVPTRTALAASPNPSPLGGMLTLTATLTVPDGTQPPAGTMRFHDGFGLIGEAPVVGSVATLSFPATIPWFRDFSAEFVGTDRLRPSRSARVPLLVYVASVDVGAGAGAGGRGAIALEAPIPNPLRGEGLVARFTLPERGAGPARLGLHDVRGRRLEEVDVAGLGPGAHAVTLRPAADLPAGLYFLRLEAGGSAVTRRVVVLGR